MATNPYADFDRDLKLITADVDPEIIRRELAAFARQSLADVIASGEAPPTYEKFVNDRQGAPEESVQLPGPITYVFTNWKLVIEAALAELERRAPKKSGRFAASFIVISGSQVVTDFSAIPPKAEVIITNAQPYVRKVETGVLKVPRFYVFDGTKNALVRRFGGATGPFNVVTRWLNIGSGVHPLIPYILRGSQGRRKDRQAGQPISYPAIIINQT